MPSPGFQTKGDRLANLDRKRSNPLPRKFLITDKKAKGLQVTALLSQWNTSPQLEESLFTFVVPAKAEQVTLRPVAAPAGTKRRKNDREDAAMQMMKRTRS